MTSFHRETSFHRAINKNDIKEIKRLIQGGENINWQDSSGKTALFKAIRAQKYKIAEILFKAGANPNIPNNSGEVVLHLINDKKRTNLVKLFLKGVQPADASIADNQCNTAPNANLILADASIADKHGNTPLHEAARSNQIGIAKILVEALDNKIDAKNKKGETPFDIACIYRRVEMATFLLKRGDTTFLLEADATNQNSDKTPSLHHACSRGSLELVKMLIKRGVAIDATDKDNRTALHIAAREEKHEIVEFLIDNKANINAIDVNKMTPIYFALSAFNMKVVEILIKKGANINIRCENDNTALHKAVCILDQSIVKLLLDNGADVKITNSQNESPLDMAKKFQKNGYKNIEIIEILEKNYNRLST